MEQSSIGKTKQRTKGAARVVAAWTLIGIGATIAIVLLTYGGPIFPHISGPIVLAALGTILLAARRRDGAR